MLLLSRGAEREERSGWCQERLLWQMIKIKWDTGNLVLEQSLSVNLKLGCFSLLFHVNSDFGGGVTLTLENKESAGHT